MGKFKLMLTALSTITLVGTAFIANAQTNAPNVHRNTTEYDIAFNAFAVLAISTNPVQANQPVYSWRTHRLKNGIGSHGLNASIIGYTDSNGSFSIVGTLPNDESLCGKYVNESFAVGSPYNPRSTPINFRIFRSLDFGPAIPDCELNY